MNDKWRAFLRGAGSVLDIAGTRYAPKPLSVEEAFKRDAENIKADFERAFHAATEKEKNDG